MVVLPTFPSICLISWRLKKFDGVNHTPLPIFCHSQQKQPFTVLSRTVVVLRLVFGGFSLHRWLHQVVSEPELPPRCRTSTYCKSLEVYSFTMSRRGWGKVRRWVTGVRWKDLERHMETIDNRFKTMEEHLQIITQYLANLVARRAHSNHSEDEDSKGSNVNPCHQRDVRDVAIDKRGRKIEETISLSRLRSGV